MVDYRLRGFVRGACLVSDAVAMGLYLQHGRERGGWDSAECAVELVQYHEVQAT